MARFRLFSKKRGEHRTMSDVGARAALGGFFATLVVIGAAILASVVGRVTINEWRANHDYLETRALVVAKEVRETHDEAQTKYWPEVQIRYEVDGRQYQTGTYDASDVTFTDREACERQLDAFDVGGEYPCWYDPQDPSRAVLVRGYSWVAWVVPLLPAAFVAVGTGGLIYLFLTWGKSAEHRALIQQSTNRDLFDPRTPGRRYPGVPHADDVTNSPGTTLKYRIPPSAPGWNLMFLSAVCIGWNTLVGWFLYRVLVGHLGSRGDYVLTVGLIPFVAVGGYLIYWAAKQLLVAGGVEPTVVEISAHPLYPGGFYEVYVRQNGKLNFRKFSVVLACDEEATFRQGTNSRTHVERIVETEAYRRETFTCDRRDPLTVRFDLQVPEGAMHSFQSSHNAVKWKLVVRGQLNHWPDFERTYALLVYPGRKGAAQT